MNAVEIIDREYEHTLWHARDSEGRRVYAVTEDMDGHAVIPTGGWRYGRPAAASQCCLVAQWLWGTRC